MKKLLVVVLALAMVLSLAACGEKKEAASVEEKFPARDITIIVPYAAGGSTDLLGRAIATQLTTDLGVNVVIQNVEGGGGTTGTSQAVNSAADGYTLAFCSNGGYLINSAVNQVGYTYDTTTPICICTELNIGIAVAADSPYQTFEDLMNSADTMTYSSPGANSTPHLLVAGLAAKGNKTWNHSPNSSSPQMVAELVGHHIDFMSVNIPTYKSYTADGSVRILAVTGDERDANYPDVPTLKELGYDFPASVYFCIVGPKDMPADVVKTLSDAFGTALENPTVIENLAKLNQPAVFVGHDDFAARVTEDYNLYNGILKNIGIL